LLISSRHVRLLLVRLLSEVEGAEGAEEGQVEGVDWEEAGVEEIVEEEDVDQDNLKLSKTQENRTSYNNFHFNFH